MYIRNDVTVRGMLRDISQVIRQLVRFMLQFETEPLSESSRKLVLVFVTRLPNARSWQFSFKKKKKKKGKTNGRKQRTGGRGEGRGFPNSAP